MPSTKTRTRPRTWILTILGVILLLVAASLGYAEHHNRVTKSAHGTVSTAANGTKAAPEPSRTYQNQQCSNTDTARPAEALNKDQWSIPAIHQKATFHNDAHGTSPELPDAPEGIKYGPSMPVGSTHGATVLAGHVDYAPGALSANGGELSPWGHLHEATACDPLTVTDENGRPHQYRITAMYTSDQNELPESELFRSDGDPALYLITCSGPSTKDAGGQFQFNYAYNLIVKAQPVS